MLHNFTQLIRGEFDENNFLWKDITPWANKWQSLSAPARLAFLQKVKSPTSPNRFTEISSNPEAINATVRQELLTAGFIELRCPRGKKTERVFVLDAVIPFANRVRSLHKYRLTAPNNALELARYVNRFFIKYPLMLRVREVMKAVGKNVIHIAETDFFNRYVSRFRWTEWVLKYLDDSLTNRVHDLIWTADKPMTRSELHTALVKHPSDQVDNAIRKLIAHLVLFEDLRNDTWKIVVGVLPAVREEKVKSLQPRVRPTLEKAGKPANFASSSGTLVDDLRVLLLELAEEPPRLKTDGTFYQKEEERLIAVLPEWTEWLASFLQKNPISRLHQVHEFARRLQMASGVDGSEHRLRLTEQGEAWLASPAHDQYAIIYRTLASTDERTTDYYACSSESVFLGDNAAVLLAKQPNAHYSIWNIPIERRMALRNALFAAFTILQQGQHYRFHSVIEHLCFGNQNPLLTGKHFDEVVIWVGGRRVHDLDDSLEAESRTFLERHIKERLVPLGCVTVGVDSVGQICIARNSRYDAYFGKAPMTADLVEEGMPTAKVVVQPDFSIIIIGANPTPAAELAPFCERVKGHAAQGSMTLKICRESVIKAVEHGMNAGEILKRLEKHASNALPTNVIHEVKMWSGWVRKVDVKTMVVIQCPDDETADRVMTALRTRGERLGATTIGMNQMSLNTADRKALKRLGVVFA
jgi:Helicase conserved C-terminal domain